MKGVHHFVKERELDVNHTVYAVTLLISKVPLKAHWPSVLDGLWGGIAGHYGFTFCTESAEPNCWRLSLRRIPVTCQWTLSVELLEAN